MLSVENLVKCYILLNNPPNSIPVKSVLDRVMKSTFYERSGKAERWPV